MQFRRNKFGCFEMKAPCPNQLQGTQLAFLFVDGITRKEEDYFSDLQRVYFCHRPLIRRVKEVKTFMLVTA